MILPKKIILIFNLSVDILSTERAAFHAAVKAEGFDKISIDGFFGGFAATAVLCTAASNSRLSLLFD